MPKSMLKEVLTTVTSLKDNVKVLTDDMQVMKSDMQVMKDELKNEIRTQALRLDQKVDNLAGAVVGLTDRMEKVEYRLDNTVATKADINVVLDQIDHFAKQVRVVDVEQGVQSFHLKEVRTQVNDHEKRLIALEKRNP